MLEPTDEQLAIIGRGQEALNRLLTHETFENWKAVGYALAVGRDDTCRALKIQRPEDGGRAYAEKYGQWLRDFEFDRIEKGTRSRLLNLIDNMPEFEAWYNTLSQDQKLKWNHPNTLWRQWPSNPCKKPKLEIPKAEDPRDDALREREAENNHLKDALTAVEEKYTALEKRQREMADNAAWDQAPELAQARQLVETVQAEKAVVQQQAEEARAQTREWIAKAKTADEKLNEKDSLIERLVAENEKLKRELAILKPEPQPDRWQQLQLDLEIREPMQTDEHVVEVPEGEPGKRVYIKWTDEMEQFLIELYDREVTLTDAELAEKMSERFKEPFNASRISQKLHKMRHEEHPRVSYR